jgi:Holliday junction resolvase
LTPEAALKIEVKKYLTDIGAFWFMPVQMGYSRRGIPDFVGCLRGRMFAIETKAEGKTPTAWQQRELAAIEAAGGIAIVAWRLSDVEVGLK